MTDNTARVKRAIALEFAPDDPYAESDDEPEIQTLRGGDVACVYCADEPVVTLDGVNCAVCDGTGRMSALDSSVAA